MVLVAANICSSSSGVTCTESATLSLPFLDCELEVVEVVIEAVDLDFASGCPSTSVESFAKDSSRSAAPCMLWRRRLLRVILCIGVAATSVDLALFSVGFAKVDDVKGGANSLSFGITLLCVDPEGKLFLRFGLLSSSIDPSSTTLRRVKLASNTSELMGILAP